MNKIYDVGVIGGGISGAVISLELARNGIDNVLFEKENSVVNGPPFCHLHAGGNLYPDISDEQCRVLLKQSIEMAKLFPQSIDERPTLISVPRSEKYKVEKIEQRLIMLVDYYKRLIAEDPSNEILGSPDDYFHLYTEDVLVELSENPMVSHPSNPKEWVTNAIHFIDIEKLKTPIFIVQEYGWNLFRLGAQAQLALGKAEHCDLKTNTMITNIKDVREQDVDYNWEVSTDDYIYRVKYLVNSCGFKTGDFDEQLHLKAERMIEFKAAYISKWKAIPGLIPEMVFHGERGTPSGMAQLTPYCNDYYQIHGMTKDITLFEDGIVSSKGQDLTPEFNDEIQEKIHGVWSRDVINTRTEKAIELVSKFVPSFSSASVGGPPLYGAQQIPGKDPSLRVGEVSFPYNSYARSEIIKASSSLAVANEIIEKIKEEDVIPDMKSNDDRNFVLENVSKDEIDDLAHQLAIERGYPGALSRLVVERE